MKSSGVRFGSCTRSIFRPGSLRFLHQPSIRSAARFMWPFSCHLGSKCGDLFGMRMYSVMVGTISFSHAASIRASALLLSSLFLSSVVPLAFVLAFAALLFGAFGVWVFMGGEDSEKRVSFRPAEKLSDLSDLRLERTHRLRSRRETPAPSVRSAPGVRARLARVHVRRR